MYRFPTLRNSDSMDDTPPLPELSFDDLLEPPTTGGNKHSDDDDNEGGHTNTLNDSLNTPRPKKAPVTATKVQILENKRLPALSSTTTSTTAYKSTAILSQLPGVKVVSPKPQITDVKVLNKIPMKATPLRIGSAIATSSTTSPVTKGLLPMTQFKTADGKVIYLQKTAIAGNVTPKIVAATTALATTSPLIAVGGGVAGTSASPTVQRRVVAAPPKALTMPPGGIQRAVLSKGVTIATTGLVKAATPISIKSSTSGTPITIKGITTLSTGKAAASGTPGSANVAPATTQIVTVKPGASISPAAATTKSPGTSASTSSPSTPESSTQSPVKVPIKVVRTSDGRLIKINQGNSAMLIGNNKQPITTKLSTTTTSGTATTTTSTTPTTTVKLSLGNVQLAKKILTTPQSTATITQPAALKVTPDVVQSKPTIVVKGVPSTATSPSTSTATSTGKILMQSSTGKQIVVSSKNIIKLSPKPSPSITTSTITKPSTSTIITTSSTGNTSTSSVSTSSSTPSVHAVPLPGGSKGPVQYVRVLANKTGASTGNTSSSVVSSKVATASTASGGNSKLLNSMSKLTVVRANTTGATTTSGATTKFVMRQMGGNIVPLPAVQTLTPKRSQGSVTTMTTTSAITSESSGSSRPLVKVLSSVDSSRKHKLSDPNVKSSTAMVTADNDGTNEGSEANTGPEAKKARYVLMMQNGKVIAGRPPGQRLTVQSAAGGSSSTSTTTPPTTVAASGSGSGKKVYNLIKTRSPNGIRYMICNTSGSTVRRPLSLAEAKHRQALSVNAQQLRIKHMKSIQQRQIQQRQLQQQQKQQNQKQKQQRVETKQPSVASGGSSNSKLLPQKNLFDILKPATPVPPPPANSMDALVGLTSRRKHCNCSKSQCLKLYCDCFANGEFCQDCTCKDCFNNLEYEDERQRAIRSCLDRNPSAFKPKITANDQSDMRLHNKGCNCKRSGCLKNYCECYEAKIPCSSNCKCVGCRNMEDRPDVDLDSMDMFSAASMINRRKPYQSVLTQQGNRTNSFLTNDVIEATIMCMISRIVMHEKQNMPFQHTEREVMEELGESLNQIIMFAREKIDSSLRG